ncbi:MAG: carboxypeptidase-like regulatory domain-containing protein [Tannerella sp.]|jgi:hypothetical protein|nr:carboxypeptidase-like regulatory domain-containing protein [Tannerella sp.]
MKRSIKQGLPALLGVIGATALACITGGVTTPALLSLAGGLSSGVASNLLSEFTPDKLKKWFVDVHPDDLNHNLKKLFVRSIGEALSNIQILYAESGASVQEKKAVRKIIQKLQKELETKMSDSTQLKLDEPEIKQFLHARQDDDAIVSYVREKFDAAGVSPSFGQFLAQHLAPQIQLCFGEGLKNPANHEAWVAFQRMLAEDLQETVNRIEQTQQEIKAEISGLHQGTSGFSDADMKEIRQLKEMLQNRNLIKVNISRGITGALKNIEAKENELIRTTTETNINVRKLKVIAIRIEKKQKQEAFVIYLFLAVTLIAIGALVFHLLNQPFTATIHVYGWEGRQHHPLDGEGAIELRLGDKTERAGINRQGEAIFKKILPGYNGKTLPVAIVETGTEPYYLADSLVPVRKNTASEIQVLLRGLEKLEGTVVDKDGRGIGGATVWTAGLSAQTNARGFFMINIPLEKQKRHQEVEIQKDGYRPYRNSAMPMAGGDGCRVILQKE